MRFGASSEDRADTGRGSSRSSSSSGSSAHGEDEASLETSVVPGTPAPGGQDEVRCLFDDIREHLARYIVVTDPSHLDILTVWIVHTYFMDVLYTTPRLIIDSPVPGSGKTTVLEHLAHLCHNPLPAASLGSPAVFSRALQNGIRTLLIDEADRTLSKTSKMIDELLAVINSGYKRGGTRPTNIPDGSGGWNVVELSTYAPVAMAGNNPQLPDDTRSRAIRVLLMPDAAGVAEESDWEVIETATQELADRLVQLAAENMDLVRVLVVTLPEEVRGRARERWKPLKKMAELAGGRWPGVVDELARRDVERERLEKEDGLVTERPAAMLMRDIHKVWEPDEKFLATDELIERLVDTNPSLWAAGNRFQSDLTPQRLGRMLVSGWDIHAGRRPSGSRKRGYHRENFLRAFQSLRLEPQVLPDPDEPDVPDRPE